MSHKSLHDIKYVICGREQTQNGARYGSLYYCRYKTDAWKLKNKINKNPLSQVYIKPAKELMAFRNAAAI